MAANQNDGHPKSLGSNVGQDFSELRSQLVILGRDSILFLVVARQYMLTTEFATLQVFSGSARLLLGLPSSRMPILWCNLLEIARTIQHSSLAY